MTVAIWGVSFITLLVCGTIIAIIKSSKTRL